jgi:hypothetical protein
MAIQTMTIGEALDQGYGDFIIGAQQAQREDATIGETAISIGLEVVPALLGGVLGGIAGGASGAGIGNYLSQQYRISRGLQEEVGFGELGAAAALGAVPVGRLANVGMAGKTAIRAGQGAGLATAELGARTMIDEGRAPTQEEIASTILFGGLFGGTLGAVEAKYLNDTLDMGVSEGATRPEVVKLLENKIDDAGGIDNFAVGRPVVTALGPRRLRVWNPKGLEGPEAAETPGELLLGGIENQLLLEAESTVSKAARAKGEEVTGQMAAIQEIFEGKDLADQAIFKGINKTSDLAIQRVGDAEEINKIKQGILALDHKLGKGKGAKKQRADFNADLRRIYKRNGMNLLDLQDDMRRAQMGANLPQAGMKDRPMKQADPMDKYEEMAEKKLGKGYEKYFTGLLTTGAGGAAAVSMLTEDEEDEMKKAGFPAEMIFVLLAAGLGVKGFRNFKKTPLYKRTEAQVKADPVKTAPDSVKAEKIKKTASPYAPPGKIAEGMKSAKEFLSDTLVPLSRKLKNIDYKLADIFRQHERVINKTTREYLDRTAPFITSMTKRLQGNEKLQRQFKLNLLNGDMDEIRIMLDDLKVSDQVGKEFSEMQRAFEDIRNYARQEGGINVGYQEGYFPRQILNYEAFRSALSGDNSDAVTRALQEYAQREGLDSIESIDKGTAAEITSRTLRGVPVQPGSSLPGNLKQRQIGRITEEEMIDGYADPADALKNYVERTVQAVERRKFLYRKPSAGGEDVGFEGSIDRQGADLGIDMEVDDSLAGQVAQRLLKDSDNFSNEDIEKLKEIIQARFSGKTVSSIVQDVKNLNYMSVMGNFGSAITQLGDLAYSIHFSGFGNTFRSLFNQKENFDFVKYFNLKDHHIDAATSAGGLSNALDKVFTVTGLKKLDQLAKNTTMNASWRKYKAQAMKNSQSLQDDLAPVFGRERAGRMVKELQNSNPSSGNLPKGVEELIWYKFLDINPATLGEMPKYYNQSGNARILYMLKSFTVKQFDVFREAGIEDIMKAKRLQSEGKSKQAAQLASKGIKNLLGLAVVFGAANATTDMIKDTLYGRPIKRDELLEDNIWRLLGINRYIVNKARREGPAKATLEMLLPPTAIFDRAWQDISAIAGDKEYKGALLQGTPLDMVYWKYLGGLDKIQDSN